MAQRLLAVVAAVALGSAGWVSPPATAGQGEQAGNELLGTWYGIAAHNHEQKFTLRSVWEVRRDGISIAAPNPTSPKNEFKYTIDAGKSPKHFDLIPPIGPAKDKVLKDVYKVENGTLTICQVAPELPDPDKRERPAEFDVSKRKDVVVLTYSRKAR
jgi:uncharacterized protein (TIGR03067 family)